MTEHGTTMTTTERVLSSVMRIVGVVLMLGGLIYGLLASADWITVCVLVEFLGVALLILDVQPRDVA